jgi:hypothetical protein
MVNSMQLLATMLVMANARISHLATSQCDTGGVCPCSSAPDEVSFIQAQVRVQQRQSSSGDSYDQDTQDADERSLFDKALLDQAILKRSSDILLEFEDSPMEYARALIRYNMNLTTQKPKATVPKCCNDIPECNFMEAAQDCANDVGRCMRLIQNEKLGRTIRIANEGDDPWACKRFNKPLKCSVEAANQGKKYKAKYKTSQEALNDYGGTVREGQKNCFIASKYDAPHPSDIGQHICILDAFYVCTKYGNTDKGGDVKCPGPKTNPKLPTLPFAPRFFDEVCVYNPHESGWKDERGNDLRLEFKCEIAQESCEKLKADAKMQKVVDHENAVRNWQDNQMKKRIKNYGKMNRKTKEAAKRYVKYEGCMNAQVADEDKPDKLTEIGCPDLDKTIYNGLIVKGEEGKEKCYMWMPQTSSRKAKEGVNAAKDCKSRGFTMSAADYDLLIAHAKKYGKIFKRCESDQGCDSEYST